MNHVLLFCLQNRFGLLMVDKCHHMAMLGNHLARQQVDLVAEVVVVLAIQPEDARHADMGKIVSTVSAHMASLHDSMAEITGASASAG